MAIKQTATKGVRQQTAMEKKRTANR